MASIYVRPHDDPLRACEWTIQSAIKNSTSINLHDQAAVQFDVENGSHDLCRLNETDQRELGNRMTEPPSQCDSHAVECGLNLMTSSVNETNPDPAASSHVLCESVHLAGYSLSGTHFFSWLFLFVDGSQTSLAIRRRQFNLIRFWLAS